MTKITPEPVRSKTNTNNSQQLEISVDNRAIEDFTTPAQKSSAPVGSIRTKLLMFVMPTLLSSLFAFATGAYLVIKNYSEEQIKIRSENQALLASKATSDLIEETLKFPKILARDPSIVAILQRETEPTQIDERRIENFFRNIAGVGDAKEISLVAVGGEKIASTRSTNQILGQNTDWWQNVRQDPIWISSPYIDPSSSDTRNKNIDLVVRVNEVDRSNFIGAIKYTISSEKLAWVTDYLMRTGIEFSDTQKVQIIDETGNEIVTVSSGGSSIEGEIIGGEDINNIGKEIINFLASRAEGTTERRREEERENKAEELSQKYQINNLEIKQHDLDFNQNQTDREYVLSASFTKGNRNYYISTIPGQNNWLAIASIQRSEIEAASRQATVWFAGMILIVSIVAIWITFWLAKQLALPLNKLAQTAEQIALGNLNLKADPKGGTIETKTLAESFNNLVAQLKSLLSQQALETRQSRLLADISNCPSLNKREAQITIERAIKRAREILGVERLLIYRFSPDEARGYVSSEAVIKSYRSAKEGDTQLKNWAVDTKIIEEYSQGKVVAIENVKAATSDPEQLQLMARLQVKAYLAVPILYQEQLYGLLIAHHCQNTYHWQEKEIIFTKQLAAQLRLLLERVEFLEERQKEAERLECLKNITLKISGSIEAEDILETAVRESRQVIKSERVIIYSFDGTNKGTVIAESVAEQWPQILGEEITDPGFVDRYLEDYKKAGVKAIPDIYKANLDEFHIKQVAAYGVKAKLIAPVLMGAQLRGLLIAHQCSSTRNWEKVEIDFLNQVATQVGLALERANLLEQQRDAREYLQERALELLREVDPLSKGDLTIRARVTEDEIGTVAYSYNSTIESLQRIVNQVKAASARVAATTDRNQISVKALSGGAISQREQIEAALVEIQAMNSSIHAVAVNAEQAETKVKQASETVQEGEIAMNRTVKGIMTIQETVSATADKVRQLGQSLQKISEVVNLIGTFAAQTNLLALKTSLEAARAGEEGRGFAVIADEIRSLAAQSAQKSDEIEKLVDKIQAETGEVVAAMEAGTTQVVSGTKLVDETRNSLEKISLVSNQIDRLVEDIAKVAVKQAETSQAVTERIAEVATISNETSSEAELVSESFEELLEVARSLQESVGQFKVA